MEPGERAKHCFERLEALKLEAPRIARVLASADEVLEQRPAAAASPGSARPVANIRVALLERSVARLRKAQRQFRPVVDGASAMLERVEDVAERIAQTRRQLEHLRRSGVHAELERLSAQIALTEKRLAALLKLMEHLNPSMSSIDYDGIAGESLAPGAGAASFERVLETAESLIASQSFCDSLNELEYLRGSAVLLEASQRLAANLDRVCEICFLWMQRASRRLWTSLCAAFDEASDVALRHSHSFVPPTTGPDQDPDEVGLRRVFERNPDAADSRALRVLQLLRLRPTYLYHFIGGMRGILGQISLKRFVAYTSAVAVHPCRRSEAVAGVLEHLQSSVTFMTNCVEGLYSNSGLPLHEPTALDHGAVFLPAPRYLRGILRLLANPLEAKLCQVMEADPVRGIEGLITCGSIVDLFTSIVIVDAHIRRLSDHLATAWTVGAAPVGISIDGPAAPEKTSPALHGRDPSGSHDQIPTAPGDHSPQIASGDSTTDGNAHDDEDAGTRTDDGGTHHAEPDTTHVEEDDEDTNESILIVKLVEMRAAWRQEMFSTIQERIVVPLAGGDAFHMDATAALDIAAPHVLHTICEFIADVTAIRAQYESAEDYERILGSTVPPTVDWCRRSAELYGENASAYLINCFGLLQQTLSVDLVPASFTDPLRAELESQVDAVVAALLGELKAALELRAAPDDPAQADAAMKRVAALIFSDGLMDCDVPAIKRLKLVSDRHQRLIRSKLYLSLADEYAKLAVDGDSPQVRALREFAAHLQ
ncbi:conserved oligomeric Golgi complex subunit 6 [Babesia caballi]|uniref:Conserved oligomeric Golgi complex subunit 6 n=1 Tax=Babesia caballi TaxID=5871 RepID=A0AAV4LY87_BABCB|nr:conserved oligomeric Golgi complex subunit 6 [Babesia caballi]